MRSKIAANAGRFCLQPGVKDKSNGHLKNNLELAERLEEAGGATLAQAELNKRRDADLVKARS